MSGSALRDSGKKLAGKTACLCLALLCAPIAAFAHKKEGTRDLALKIFEAASRFAPEITGEFIEEPAVISDSKGAAVGFPLAEAVSELKKEGLFYGSQAAVGFPLAEAVSEKGAAPQNLIVPYIKFQGRKIYLTSGFWKLTQYWLRLYLREIQNYCPCDLDPGLLIEEAKSRPPENLVYKKTRSAALKGAEVMTKWIYTYGTTYAVMKAAMEAAETILSTAVGGKGFHAFCRFNDLIVIFAARKIQKISRTFYYGKALNKSRLIMILKHIWLSRLLKKARRRAFFIIENSMSLRDEEALLALDQEARRPGNRIRWLRKAAQGPQPIAIKRDRFFGKRSFLIIPRKRNSQYMRGKNFADQVTSNGLLWILSIQENILYRALEASESWDSKKPAQIKAASFESAPDSIRQYLLDEFLSKNHPGASETEKWEIRAALEPLLQDVENIFNPDLPSFERYLYAHIIEISLGFFAERQMQILADKLKEIKGMQTLSERVELQKHTGLFIREAYGFADFLLSVSMAGDREKLAFYKYESMKKILAFFGHLRETHAILKVARDKTPQEIFKSFEERNKEFAALAPGREKRTVLSFIPFKDSLPKCRDLAARRL